MQRCFADNVEQLSRSSSTRRREWVDESVAEMEGPMLTGEVPDTVHPDDVEHWVAVYSELVAGTARLREPVVADPRVDMEYEHLRRRLDFWLCRRAQLQNSPI